MLGTRNQGKPRAALGETHCLTTSSFFVATPLAPSRPIRAAAAPCTDGRPPARRQSSPVLEIIVEDMITRVLDSRIRGERLRSGLRRETRRDKMAPSRRSRGEVT